MYFIMAFGIYAATAVYLGFKLRTFWILERLYEKRPIYWTLMFVSIGLVFLHRSFGIGFLIYLCMLYVISDLIYVSIRHRGRNAIRQYSRFYLRGLPVLVLAAIIAGYGYYNANHIQLTSYEIKMKEAEAVPFSIAMISDVHLGTAVTIRDLDQVVDRINQLRPDLICICGDLYDESTEEWERAESYPILGKLAAPLGVYYIEGNHEVTSGNLREILLQLDSVGIHVLEDECVLIDDRFYLVGRKDYCRETGSSGRMPLDQLLRERTKEYPVILLDHQPVQLNNAAEMGVSLALSGHTHAGQIFPGNFFAGRINDQNYGLHSYGSMSAITSSGLGTWGFVLRTNAHSEIVWIQISN